MVSEQSNLVWQVYNVPHRYSNQYGIIQHYLPSGRSDIPAFTPAIKANIRFSKYKGMLGQLAWLHSKSVYPSVDGHHPNINWAQHTVTLFMQ